MIHNFDQALSLAGFEIEREGQRAVFNAFRAGKHVILRAPTGWGKTFAVMAALGEGHAIYSLPLRVLVDSLAHEAATWKIRHVKAHHGNRREHAFLDQGNDITNPVNCVFTTLDQSLSAYLGIPVGVSMRQGNILPGVIEASHLVFDEFHLFEAAKSWKTALHALVHSRQNGIILTATLSDAMISFLEETLYNTPHGVKVIEAKRPFVNAKKITKGDGLDSSDRITLGERTIIIRNQIEAAKTTATLLRNNPNVPGKVYLLHSELLAADRQRIEQEVRQVFGKYGKGPAVLVATQVVEAGIDITCDVLHIDLCPPSSLIQRIGRSARYEGETAQIFWHPVETTSPYTYKCAKEETDNLESYLSGITELTPESEHFITNLSSKQDLLDIEEFKKFRDNEWVYDIRIGREYTKYAEHIRDIDSVNVAIGELSEQPYHFLSLAPSKFHGNGPYANIPARFIKLDYDRKTKKQIPQEISNIRLADYILLHPENIGYDPDFGLTQTNIGGEELFLKNVAKSYEKHRYEGKAEKYREHIERLQKYRPVSHWIFKRLADRLGSLQRAIYLADFVIWAHDLGKLDIEWQAAHGVPENGIPIAHSGEEDFPRLRQPPSHAWVSAWAVADFLWYSLFKTDDGKKIARPVFWAIADHHGYRSEMARSSMQPYRLAYFDHLDGMQDMAPWTTRGWNSSILTTKVSASELEIINRQMIKEGMKSSDYLDVYYLLSYILRRSDQLATAEVSTTFSEESKNITQRDNFL
ncbi:CRISPR-associated helicase/endonuclease Cas3 [Nibrella viscosa]|uniref:CRISPR-associated helicase/endonuclease Cas3 n=1 Tax=Nibrella viscosa TaxID=1084524 RepID=A0ABP8KT92_9BACT